MSAPAWGLVALWATVPPVLGLVFWLGTRDRRATYTGLGAAELAELAAPPSRAERLAALDGAWVRFTATAPPISTLRSVPDNKEPAVTPGEFTDSALPAHRQPTRLASSAELRQLQTDADRLRLAELVTDFDKAMRALAGDQ